MKLDENKVRTIANQIIGYAIDAAGDVGFSGIEYVEGKFAEKRDELHKEGVNDTVISDIISDMIYDDPSFLRDISGDQIYDHVSTELPNTSEEDKKEAYIQVAIEIKELTKNPSWNTAMDQFIASR